MVEAANTTDHGRLLMDEQRQTFTRTLLLSHHAEYRRTTLNINGFSKALDVV